jgi:Fur family zinc uptake transcriptional regulator
MMDSQTTALTRIKDSGLRITKQRRTLIDYLCQQSNHYVPVTAVDAHMRTLYPGMSHDTIYRNLKEFAALDVVETEVQGERSVVKIQCDYQHPHHHHFICTNCHRVQEIQLCPEDFFAQQLPGARITGHNVELYGLCADCAQTQSLADK